jgi:hypothetical protein
MLEPGQPTPKFIVRQVFGWVLVLPLLVSFIKLPFPLALVLSLGVLAASLYGVQLARRHASRRVALFAAIVTALNGASFLAMSTPSVLKALYYIVWLYAYPHYSNWAYWSF